MTPPSSKQGTMVFVIALRIRSEGFECAYRDHRNLAKGTEVIVVGSSRSGS